MKILIVGAGKVGATLAAYLSQEDHDITIVDNNDAAIHRASDTLDVMCIKGPGAAPSVLREAGAAEADLVLATTNMDEVNMLCALTAKRLGTKYTIARIRDVAYTDDIAALRQDLNIDAVINPEYSAALEISRLLRFPAAANVEIFFRGRVEMLGIIVREADPIVGKPLSELFSRTKDFSILFSAAERRGEVIIPDGSFVPAAGDKLYIIGTPQDLADYLRSLGRDVPTIHSAFLIGGRLRAFLVLLISHILAYYEIHVEFHRASVNRLRSTYAFDVRLAEEEGSILLFPVLYRNDLIVFKRPAVGFLEIEPCLFQNVVCQLLICHLRHLSRSEHYVMRHEVAVCSVAYSDIVDFTYRLFRCLVDSRISKACHCCHEEKHSGQQYS